MKRKTNYRLYWCILLLVIVVIMTMFTLSCPNTTYVEDPLSVNPGYKLFMGKTKGFQISFEYPADWRRVALERGGSRNRLVLLPHNCSVIISSVLNINQDGVPINASDVIQSNLALDSARPEFKIISRSQIQIGQGTGEKVIYSNIWGGPDPHMPMVYAEAGDTVITWIVDIDYKGRIYDLYFIASSDKYEDAISGFEHILDTFKFLN